jgi:hypothetical protein
VTVRARPGRLIGRSISHSRSVLYTACVWAHRALNRPKRRLPARAVNDTAVKHKGWVLRQDSLDSAGAAARHAPV